jgi:alkanesulfonate monooxygenase SsuD/methylene tetrahydromethanopterin reductase-like flavin-dependent oxidoreductase (luciferase family)
MVAIIGGETRRFRPLVDLYRETGAQFGHAPDRLKVGVHCPGYVASSTQAAIDDFFPGFARAISSVAKERGWRAVTRADLGSVKNQLPVLAAETWTSRRAQASMT